MDKILLIDLHNQLWRANMSWGKSTSKESKNVMIYNFFRNTRALIEQFYPNKVFLVAEGMPKHRYAIYKDYKANRIIKVANNQEAFDDFHHNKREIIKILNYLPVTVCKAKDYECDDVIASLAENLKSEEVTIVSNDSDYIQLLQKGYENIKIFNPIKKEYMKPPEYHYLAWKCLSGDKSDNIPGLISLAKANKLISNPKLFNDWISLEENRANFSINKSLIEFAIVPLEEIEMTEGQTNFQAVKEEFTRMEFNSMLKEPAWSKFCNTFKCINI